METTVSRSQLIPDRFKQPFYLIWLWVVPQLLMLFLNGRAWTLAIGEMTVAQKAEASWIVGSELALLLIGLGTAVTLKATRRPVGYAACGLGLLLHAGYLWLFMARCGKAWPVAVAPWMLPETELVFYQFALAMPGLFYCGLRLACFDAPLRRSADAALSLGGLLLVPAAWFLLFQLGRWFSRWPSHRFAESVAFVFFIVSTLLVMMAFLRLLLLLYGTLSGYRWGRFMLPLAAGLLAPLGGLLLNRKIPFPCDFQAPGIYLLTVINGAVLLIPRPASDARAVWLWLLRSALYAFSLYFFVVFLPFIPLSLLAMLVCGAGFLILAPTLLFVIHTRQLLEEGAAIAARWGRFRTVLAFAACLLVIPLGFTARALADKAALRQALNAAYSPDFRVERTALNRTAAQRGLRHLRDMKDGITLPFLSDYYNVLVFNNMVLTDDKMNALHRMFFGEPAPQPSKRERWSFFFAPNARVRSWGNRVVEPPRAVELLDISSEETVTGDLVRATVTLSLRNQGAPNAEFVTEMEVPDGVLVTGYWLDVQGRRKPGRLVEKKTAQWVYHMIRDFTRRDPGLLVFLDDTRLKLSVYPFGINETRTSGIEFLFPRGLQTTLRVAAREITLGASVSPALDQPLAMAVADGRMHLVVSGAAARRLPAVTRVPYLHFIVDRSACATNGAAALAAGVGRVLAMAPDPSAACRVTFVNYDWRDASRDPMPGDAAQRAVAACDDAVLPAQGGFCYDRAIARGLLQWRETQTASAGGALSVPVFVVLPARGSVTVPTVDLAPFRRLVPDAPAYYLATESGLVRTPFESGVSQTVARIELPAPVLAFATEDGLAVCRSDADAAQLTLPGVADALGSYDPAAGVFKPVRATLLPGGSAYEQGLTLWDDYRATRWSPHTLDAVLPRLMETSRATGVLTPLAAYMVVETMAQDEILKRKEKQALGASHALGFEEKHTVQESPEPSLLWLSLVVVVLIRRKTSVAA